MRVKITFLALIAVFMAVAVQSCATMGSRINMDEYRKQMEEKKQAEAAATAEAAVTPEATAAAEAATPAETAQVAAPQAAEQETTKAEPAVTAETAVETAAETVPVESKAKAGAGIMLFLVFVLAFCLFALLFFIFFMKKKDEKEAEKITPPAAPGSGAEPEKAVREYGAHSVKPAAEKEQGPQAEPEKPAKHYAAPVAEPDEEQEAAKEALANTETAPQPQVAVPEKGRYGEGAASVSPVEFMSGSRGNVLHIKYKVGADSPQYRTIKITIPEGWSRPSMINTDEGYFAAVLSEGNIIKAAVEGMTIIINAYGLPAGKGELLVTYGERRGGGLGAAAQALPGEAVFKVETEARGTDEIKEIEDSPVVDVN